MLKKQGENGLSQPEQTVGWPALNTWFLGILFLISLLADAFPHAVFNYIAAMFFGIFAVNMARKTPFSFALLAGFIFLRLTMFVSGIAIGSSAYMPEVAQFGAPSGAFARLCMIYIFFMGIIQKCIEPGARGVMIRALAQKEGGLWGKIDKQMWVWGFFAVCLLLWAMAMYTGARDGFPFFTGSDKMAFRIRNADSPFFISTLNNRPLIIGFLGVIFWESKNLRRKVALGIYIAYGILSVLCGEKFTSLLSMLVMFFVPVMLKMAKDYPWQSIRNQGPILIVMVLVSAITVPLMLRVYSGDEGMEAGLTKFYERVASQAQLWYLVDQDTHDFLRFDSEAMREEWLTWWRSDPTPQMNPPYAGLYNVMAVYAPPATFAGNIDQQLGFTMAFEAYLLKCFGWLGFLPVLGGIAFLYALVLRYWMQAIFTTDPVSLFLALKMLVWVKGALVDGDLYFMFGYKMLLFVAVVVLYEKMVKGYLRLGRR